MKDEKSTLPETESENSSEAVGPSNNGVDYRNALSDQDRKVIRKANFKCLVGNVFAVMNDMEKVVASKGGVITESDLENSIYDKKVVSYKPDSLREVSTYNTTGILTVRIPVQYLDSFCASIPTKVFFVEHRNFQQDDVTYNYALNEMLNKSTEESLSNAPKTSDKLRNRQYTDEQKKEVIERDIENQRMLANVRYAEATLEFRQPAHTASRIIPNPDVKAVEPFYKQAGKAFGYGIDILKRLVIVCIMGWPLLLLTLIGVLWYLRRQRVRTASGRTL
jgi:hypothetical protein